MRSLNIGSLGGIDPACRHMNLNQYADNIERAALSVCIGLFVIPHRGTDVWRRRLRRVRASPATLVARRRRRSTRARSSRSWPRHRDFLERLRRILYPASTRYTCRMVVKFPDNISCAGWDLTSLIVARRPRPAGQAKVDRRAPRCGAYQ